MPKSTADRKLEAYQIIIAATSNFAKTKEELLARLTDEDFDLTERTLQIYIADLRDKGVEFEERRVNRVKYFKLIRDSDNTFLNFLEYSYFQNQLLNKLNTNTTTRIYKETDKSKVSIESVRIVADAILNKKVLNVSYEKFDGEKSQPVLHPYLLKEYNGLWYVISGREGARFSLRTYAIDRIKLAEEDANKPFDNSLSALAHEQIQHVIGISYTDRKPQLITLSCDTYEWNYLKINPIHASQSFIEESENEVLFTLFVVDNYEFRQVILWHYGRVKLVSPSYLKRDIQKFHESISLVK